MEILEILLKAAGIFSALTGALSLTLVIAQKYLADFGICNLSVNKERRISLHGGGNLLAGLMDNSIFVPSACGGKATCGYCKVKILSGGGPVLATEEPYLTDEEKGAGIRLSCCVRVRNDIEVELPPEILSLREYTTRVERIKNLTYDIKEIRLALTEPDSITFRPGQYVQFKVPPYGKSLEPVYRAYSMASAPSENHALEFVIRLVPRGIATTYIFEHLKEYDILSVNGPYGEFTLREGDSSEIIFVAGSTGIAPIKSMLQTMLEEGSERRATLYFGAVQNRDLFYMDIMHGFEKKLKNFTFVPSLSKKTPQDEWLGEEGLITEVVARHLKNSAGVSAYLCGSAGMIDACIRVLEGKGLTADRIFFDKFE